MFASTGLAASTARPVARRAAIVVVALLFSLLAALVADSGAAHATSAGRGTSNVPARTATETKIAKSLLSMLNRERAAHHLAPMAMDSHLLLSSRRHNLAMARGNEMSHQLRGEPALANRVTAAGYKWSWAGENIGWNSRMDQQGVLQLQTMMYNEKAPNDGHRQNILNTHFKNIGVDVYFDRSHHKVWLTTDFGRH